jgi:hypothetical protein
MDVSHSMAFLGDIQLRPLTSGGIPSAGLALGQGQAPRLPLQVEPATQTAVTAIITATMGSLGFEPSLDAVRETTEAGVGHAFTIGLRNAYLVMMALCLIGMAVSSFKGERIAEMGTPASAVD